MGQAALKQQVQSTPTPGVYQIDTAHSSIGFVARHLMVAKARGRFDEFSGSVQVGATAEESSVDVTIDAGSIQTGQAGRDEHLRSADFLNVAAFPTLRYRSTSATQTGPSTLRIEGELTIRDITRPVTLDARFEGTVVDPWGNDRIAFSARAEIDRYDFGVTWNQALETGGVVVGPKVKIEIDVALVKPQA